MRRRYASLAALALLTAATSCAPAADVLENEDPEQLSWIAPSADSISAPNAPFELAVWTQNPTGTIVHFAVDGREIGSCDATQVDEDASESDCFEEGFYRFTTRVAEAGAHTATVWFVTDEGSRFETTRSFVISTSAPAGPRPALAIDDSDVLPTDLAGAGEVDIDVPSERLPASTQWHRHGELEYASAGSRIVVRTNDRPQPRVEVGSADEIAECMDSLGTELEQAAATHHVDAATMVALAMVRTDCTPDDPGGPMRIPFARCAVLANTTVQECTTRLRADLPFALDVAARDLEATRAIHENDPMREAAVFSVGGLRDSNANRFGYATPPDVLDEFVRAFNAYRSWRSDGLEAPSCPAGTSCAVSAIRARQTNPCRGRHPNAIHARRGEPTHGTAGDDVIIGTNGDDVIDGGGGNDIICGRGGKDQIDGGDGDDYIDGGSRPDHIDGGGGNDTIYGRIGGDVILGGPGNDAIFGGPIDDDLYGGPGDDLIVGGHGTDLLNGGDGNDWLRGDTGWDTFVGGGGTDTASFATAMPPGEGLPGMAPTVDGVVVDMNQHLAETDRKFGYLISEYHMTREQILAAGLASGDSVGEVVDSVERYLGSSFDDRFDVGAAEVLPSFGNDTCNGARCAGSMARPMGAFVSTSNMERDAGLLVVGGASNDTFHLSRVSDDVLVTAPAGSTLTPGQGCRHDAGRTNVVRCAFDGAHPLRFIAGFGDAGDDRIIVGDGISPLVETHLNGGEGSDYLRGGRGDDCLFSGPTGEDQLFGRGGDDALLSESSRAEISLLDAEAYRGGADHLHAGAGDDQLVADYPCGGHEFSGGRGADIAGFRRAEGGEHGGIRAQFGGPVSARNRKPFHGRAFHSDRCGYRRGTRLRGDLETLETSTGNDEVYGDDRANIFISWDGNDVIYGYGGNDSLHGMEGDDQMFGGEGDDEMNGDHGADRFSGGAGYDRIEAGGGAMDRDLSIDCGGGGGRLATTDDVDPRGEMCDQ